MFLTTVYYSLQNQWKQFAATWCSIIFTHIPWRTVVVCFSANFQVYLLSRHCTYMYLCIFSITPSFSRLESETSGCFTDKQPSTSHNSITTSSVPPLQVSAGVGASRSTSNVFRSGDYNLSLHTPRGHFLTVQKQDYQHKNTVPPAGVATATKKAYSHVLPRYMPMLVGVFVQLPSVSHPEGLLKAQHWVHCGRCWWRRTVEYSRTLEIQHPPMSPGPSSTMTKIGVYMSTHIN